MVLVTHHVEEVPDGFTHAMLLRRGSVLTAGPVEEVFTAKNLSRAFGVPRALERPGRRGAGGGLVGRVWPGRAGATQ